MCMCMYTVICTVYIFIYWYDVCNTSYFDVGFHLLRPFSSNRTWEEKSGSLHQSLWQAILNCAEMPSISLLKYASIFLEDVKPPTFREQSSKITSFDSSKCSINHPLTHHNIHNIPIDPSWNRHKSPLTHHSSVDPVPYSPRASMSDASTPSPVPDGGLSQGRSQASGQKYVSMVISMVVYVSWW